MLGHRTAPVPDLRERLGLVVGWEVAERTLPPGPRGEMVSSLCGFRRACQDYMGRSYGRVHTRNTLRRQLGRLFQNAERACAMATLKFLFSLKKIFLVELLDTYRCPSIAPAAL